MYNFFGVQILETVEDRHEGVDKLFFFVEKFIMAVNTFGGLGLESGKGLFVEDTGGQEGSGEEMIVEEMGLLGGYNWGLKILVQIFGGFMDHDDVLGLEFVNGQFLCRDSFHLGSIIFISEIYSKSIRCYL